MHPLFYPNGNYLWLEAIPVNSGYHGWLMVQVQLISRSLYWGHTIYALGLFLFLKSKASEYVNKNYKKSYMFFLTRVLHKALWFSLCKYYV